MSEIEIKLKNLSIGCEDGKTESEADEYDFTDLFYTENSKVEEMNKSTSYIISGRKGTGKTILAKYLEVNKTRECKLLSSEYINLPDDIKQTEFIERSYNEIEEDEYNLFPKFYVLNTMAQTIAKRKVRMFEFLRNSQKKNLLANLKTYSKYKKTYKILAEFLSEINPSGNFMCQEFTHEISNESRIKANANSEHAGVGGEQALTETTSKQQKIKKYPARINELEKLVFSCIEVNPIMLIFDDIDDIKRYIENELMIKKFLIGMIKCVGDINSKISKKNKFNKCIIVIRDDIIQDLNSFDSNLNKTVITSEVNLDWIGNNQENALIDMVLHKMACSTELLKNKNASLVLRDIFAGKTVYKCEKMMRRIIASGFGRPRDVITYLNIIIKNNKESNKITYGMIKAAYNEYSNSFWNELQNELYFYYPNEFIKAIQNILSSMGKKSFMYGEIQTFFNANHKDYQCIDDFDKFMDAMYKFGIIGNFRRGEDREEKASFAYRKDGKSKLDKNDYITVHYGLRPIFNL